MADSTYTRELAGELRKTLRDTGTAVQDLALPDDPVDGRTYGHAEFVANVRALSLQDPTYLATVLDRIAPRGPTLPDGTRLRPETGLKNFFDLVKEARPDIYTAVVLTAYPPGQEPITLSQLEQQQQAAQAAAQQAQMQQMGQVQPQPAPGGF